MASVRKQHSPVAACRGWLHFPNRAGLRMLSWMRTPWIFTMAAAVFLAGWAGGAFGQADRQPAPICRR